MRARYRSYPREFAALETEYRGVRYRSRLEARWAVLFDVLGFRYEYEPQGYQTRHGNYLPDFWMPQFRAFAEVKPVPFTLEQRAKCAEVAHGTRQSFLLLVGQPDTAPFWMLMPDCTLEPCSLLALWTVVNAIEGPDDVSALGNPDLLIAQAIGEARSARFGT
jgi:hypothetical protein